MALPSSGIISFSAINVELGRAANAPISLNDPAVRALLGKPSGAIGLSDGYGKSNNVGNTNTMVVGSTGTGAYGYDTGMIGVYGSMTPTTVMIGGVSHQITYFMFNAPDNSVYLLFEWEYAYVGNLFVTYNGVKYKFIQDTGIPSWYFYSAPIAGLFDTGQTRGFAITTS